MKIVLPNTLCEIDLKCGPFFFLAGPVRGGDDWQKKCCLEISKHIFQDFSVAIPCRYEDTHPLKSFRQFGTEDGFDRQLTWERYYLDMAAKKGCIIFWLPCESTVNPRLGPDPYAMDTRGELGEWRGRLMHDPSLRIVIGADSSFPGLSQIKRNFNLALGSDFPIYSTLEKTVLAAVRRIRS